MFILEKIFNIKNLKNLFFGTNPAINNRLTYQKISNLKKIFHVQSILEIRPFNPNIKELACKLKNSYIIFSVERNDNKYSFKRLGIMHIYKDFIDNTEYYPIDTYYSMYIKRLKAENPKQGIGTKLIHLARCESLRYDCNGRIHLDAVNRDNPPFYFYRKLGFTTQDTNKLNIIDKYMQSNTQFPEKYNRWCISMYLPISKDCRI